MITEIDSDAAVVVRRDIVVHATLERVWNLHTDVAAWPSWQPDITTAEIGGPLKPGATFRWSTAGLAIESTVYAVEPPSRILWGGPAHGITGIHLWTFRAENGVVHVHTEESWDGEPVRADADGMHAALDGSLAAWLQHLKKAAESV